MSSIRLDKVVHSTLHEAFKNYATSTGTIHFDADILPPGFTQNYPITGPLQIPYNRGGTTANVFVENSTRKYLANAGIRAAGAVYTPISTETVSVIVDYSSTTINITLSLFNGSGGSITLIPQDILVSVVQYDAPITPI